jgi:hypothetical protein
MTDQVEGAPIRRKPGRPATGRLPYVSCAAPETAVNAIKAEADRRGCNYSTIMREALTAYAERLITERAAA